MEIQEKEQIRIHFFTPNEINNLLDDFTIKEEKEVKRIKGYRMKVNDNTSSDLTKYLMLNEF